MPLLAQLILTSSGLQTTIHLLAHGARVYLGTRSGAKYDTAVAEIRSHPSLRLSNTSDLDAKILLIDHLNLESVVKAAEFVKAKEEELHGLVNNAAIMGTAYEKTADGYESQWQVSYISIFSLVSTLQCSDALSN